MENICYKCGGSNLDLDLQPGAVSGRVYCLDCNANQVRTVADLIDDLSKFPRDTKLRAAVHFGDAVIVDSFIAYVDEEGLVRIHVKAPKRG